MTRCPICGSAECSYLYRNGNEIVGCEHCVVMVELYEVSEDE